MKDSLVNLQKRKAYKKGLELEAWRCQCIHAIYYNLHHLTNTTWRRQTWDPTHIILSTWKTGKPVHICPTTSSLFPQLQKINYIKMTAIFPLILKIWHPIQFPQKKYPTLYSIKWNLFKNLKSNNLCRF